MVAGGGGGGAPPSTFVTVTVDGPWGAGQVACSTTVVVHGWAFSVTVMVDGWALTVTVDGAGQDCTVVWTDGTTDGATDGLGAGFGGVHLPPELKVILVHLGWLATGVV